MDFGEVFQCISDCPPPPPADGLCFIQEDKGTLVCLYC